MIEKVTLVGGPFDGQQIEWEGGDLIKMVIGTPLGFNRDGEAPANGSHQKQDMDQALYRRSLVNAGMFVFQP